MYKGFLFIALICLCFGCASREQELRDAGESVTRDFLSCLRQIEERADLDARMADIEAYYLAYARLLVDAGVVDEDASEQSALSAALQAEILRIYALPGGREKLERAQLEALRYLAKHG